MKLIKTCEILRRNTKIKTLREVFYARVGIDEIGKAVAENWQRQKKISTGIAETDKVAIGNKLQKNASAVTTEPHKFALENKVQKISSDNCGSLMKMIKHEKYLEETLKARLCEVGSVPV